jgi:hypothetical protein
VYLLTEIRRTLSTTSSRCDVDIIVTGDAVSQEQEINSYDLIAWCGCLRCVKTINMWP